MESVSKWFHGCPSNSSFIIILLLLVQRYRNYVGIEVFTAMRFGSSGLSYDAM